MYLPGELGCAKRHLLQLAESPRKTSIKGCPKYRTTAEKFKAPPVSILQPTILFQSYNPFRKNQETERTLLKAKYIARTSKITGKGIKHI